MNYQWAMVYVDVLASPKVRRAHRRPETADLGWVWVSCILLARRADAHGRLVDGGEPLDVDDLADQCGKPAESVRACVDALLAWGAEPSRDAHWLRRDADGCLVVAALDNRHNDHVDTDKKRAQDAARARKYRGHKLSRSASRDGHVTRVTPDADADADADLSPPGPPPQAGGGAPRKAAPSSPAGRPDPEPDLPAKTRLRRGRATPAYSTPKLMQEAIAMEIEMGLRWPDGTRKTEAGATATPGGGALVAT